MAYGSVIPIQRVSRPAYWTAGIEFAYRRVPQSPNVGMSVTKDALAVHIWQRPGLKHR